MRRTIAIALLPMIGVATAQIDDRGYSSNELNDFSFQQEAFLTADTDIPPVSQRDKGPSIEVTEFQFETIPEFPELGISRVVVEQLAEQLRQQYSRQPDELASGYTEQELQAIAALLPVPEGAERGGFYSIDELEQIADYLLSISDSDALAGLRQYELKGLVDLLAIQRLANSVTAVDLQQLNSLVLDDLIRLLKQQRAERGINFYELEDIAAKISAFYRSRGVFLAKAYIPVQSVEDGVVTLNILPGLLSEVTLTGNKKYLAEQLVRPFSDSIGKAANSEAIEEALFIINDLPGLMVQGALSPGSKIGETALNLSVAEEKPWRLTMTADNHGAVFTGDNRLLTMVDWYNPLGHGDIMTIGYLKSWSPLNSDVAVLQYRTPLWNQRSSVYIAVDVNEFSVDGNGDANIDDLNIEGTNTNYTMGMDYQFKRLPNLGFSAGFAITEKETDIDAVIDLPNAGEKVQGVQINASFNNINQRFSLMNMAMASVQYGEFKSGVDTDQGQDEEFYKLAVDWSVLKLVDLPFTDYQSYILAKSKWRYSESTLPAFEQLPLGGADAVRAFTVSDFSADKAAYLSAEWYLELPTRWLSESSDNMLKVALFVDGAYGSNNIELQQVSDSWANMAGAGLLFKFSWEEMFSTAISFSKPLSSKSNLDNFGDDADSIQTYVEFTFTYD